MHPRTHLLSPFVTFRSVGLGSYLRAHICHSYPGSLSCIRPDDYWTKILLLETCVGDMRFYFSCELLLFSFCS